jgi:hypothetical protein
MNQLIDNLLSEADLDNDGLLSFNEFQHVVMKSSADFLRYRILVYILLFKVILEMRYHYIERKVNSILV